MTRIVRNLCPDCDSEAVIREIAPGLATLEVRHDGTCPELARIEGSRTR